MADGEINYDGYSDVELREAPRANLRTHER